MNITINQKGQRKTDIEEVRYITVKYENGDTLDIVLFSKNEIRVRYNDGVLYVIGETPNVLTLIPAEEK